MKTIVLQKIKKITAVMRDYILLVVTMYVSIVLVALFAGGFYDLRDIDMGGALILLFVGSSFCGLVFIFTLVIFSFFNKNIFPLFQYKILPVAASIIFVSIISFEKMNIIWKFLGDDDVLSRYFNLFMYYSIFLAIYSLSIKLKDKKWRKYRHTVCSRPAMKNIKN